MNLFIKNKSQLRRFMRNKRDSAIFDEEHNDVILQNILQILKICSFENLGLYWPMNGEPNLIKLTVQLENKISFPKIINNQLYFIKYQLGDQIIKHDNLDLYQPLADNVIKPQAIIMPAIAYDIKGYRIGFGLGHYDRYIKDIKKVGSMIIIGVCFHQFLIDNIMREDHDQKVDYIVTEKLILKL